MQILNHESKLNFKTYVLCSKTQRRSWVEHIRRIEGPQRKSGSLQVPSAMPYFLAGPSIAVFWYFYCRSHHIISSVCHDNGSRAAGAGDEFADVEVDEHIKPRNKALLIYETSL